MLLSKAYLKQYLVAIHFTDPPTSLSVSSDIVSLYHYAVLNVYHQAFKTNWQSIIQGLHHLHTHLPWGRHSTVFNLLLSCMTLQPQQTNLSSQLCFLYFVLTERSRRELIKTVGWMQKGTSIRTVLLKSQFFVRETSALEIRVAVSQPCTTSMIHPVMQIFC